MLSPLLPRDARAQSSPENLAKGKALYTEAVTAMEAKDYAAACLKLEEIIRLVPEGVGAKLTVAECYEADGRLASAWSAYAVAEAAALKAEQKDRQKKAHDRAAALEPRLSKLTIVVPASVSSLPGLEVRRDGALVGPEQWSVPAPVDGGKHRIDVVAEGKRPWEKVIDIQASGAQESIEIGALVDIKIAAPEPRPAPPPPPRPVAVPSGSSRRTAGLIVGVGGLAGIVAGASFGFVSMTKKSASNADGHCGEDNLCDATGVALRDDALTAGTVSTVLFIAGGALAAGGAVLFFTAPSAPAAARAEVVLGPGGLGLRGRW